jgi:DNA-binding transcriptional MerR regulator
MEEDKTYSIGAVSKMVGVLKYKLRQWCDRYLPDIQRIKIGEFQVQRRFTGQDIELIGRIKAYRDRGFTLDAAVLMVSQLSRHSPQIPPDLPLTKGGITPLWKRGARGDFGDHVNTISRRLIRLSAVR